MSVTVQLSRQRSSSCSNRRSKPKSCLRGRIHDQFWMQIPIGQSKEWRKLHFPCGGESTRESCGRLDALQELRSDTGVIQGLLASWCRSLGDGREWKRLRASPILTVSGTLSARATRVNNKNEQCRIALEMSACSPQ